MFSVRVIWLVLLTVAIWLLDWILFLTTAVNPVFLAAPFMFLTLLLASMMIRRVKRTGKQPQPPITRVTAFVLILLIVFVFIAGLYYSAVLQLFWNINAFLTVIFAYFVTMRSEETSSFHDRVPSV